MSHATLLEDIAHGDIQLMASSFVLIVDERGYSDLFTRCMKVLEAAEPEPEDARIIQKAGRIFVSLVEAKEKKTVKKAQKSNSDAKVKEGRVTKKPKKQMKASGPQKDSKAETVCPPPKVDLPVFRIVH
uniref:DUF4116 domain-containing protein n=1 Tax=Steinernema glaseri TaxID=37863 RepID=A0A1I7Y3I7_9BILA